MNELQAQQLTERIKQEAPHLNAEPIRHGYPGHDEIWYVKISISRDGITSSTELDDEHAWLVLKASMKVKESKQVKTEHYVFSDGQLAGVKPVAQTDVATQLVGQRGHDNFSHEIQLITTPKWPYPFVVRTSIQIPQTGKEPEIVYLAFTWFHKLGDLLEYIAKYLPPEESTSNS